MQVFVYGTLTDPDRVERVLERTDANYEFVGRATLEGLHRVDGRYPTLAPGGSVDGRLLAVDATGLERLDEYEGVDRGLYTRLAVPRVDGGRVWTYVGDPSRLDVDTPRWEETESFPDSVRAYRSRNKIVVQSAE